ncbi:translocation/assembly module TamB domain-containing protein [Thaumasiovibrio sp. DFM-14]|uniref:autotransporter assembly complex protein TamB n=1 Tax=Thaumasiovibrio sp. DFM-14 TaxID=3384792 RepID=UPI0039A06680
MVRWCKWLLITVGFVLLLLAVLFWSLLMTPLGTSLLIWAGPKWVDGLTIEKGEGALLQQISLSELRYETAGVVVSLAHSDIALDRGCLWQKQLCISSINVSGTHVEISESTADVPAEELSVAEQPLSISAPFPMYLTSLVLEDVTLDLADYHVTWKSLRSGLEWQGEAVSISPTVWDQLLVVLPPSPSPSSADEEMENSSSVENPADDIALTLPEVRFPVGIELAELTLLSARIEGTGEPIEVDRLILAADANTHQLTIDRLDLAMPQGHAELNGQISFLGDYPLQLDVSLETEMQPLPAHQVTLNARGSVAQLQLSGALEGKLDLMLEAELQPLSPELPFNIKAVSKHLQWPLADADYQLSETRLLAKGSLDGYHFDAETHFTGHDIPSGSVTAKGSGTLQDVVIDALSVEALEGKVDASGKFAWQPALSWEAEIDAVSINPEVLFADLPGRLNGQLTTSGQLASDGGYSLSIPRVQVSGDLLALPLDLSGQLAIQGDQLHGMPQIISEGLALSHGSNRIQVVGSVEQQWAMTMSIFAPDLASSIPQLRGSIEGDIEAVGTLLSPQLTLNLAAEQLGYADAFTSQTLTLRGDIASLSPASAALRLSASGVGLADSADFEQVNVALNGSEAAHQLTLELQGEPVNVAIVVEGALQREEGWNGALKQGQIDTLLGRWVIDTPAKIDVGFAQGQVIVSDHCWRQNDASICLTKPAELAQQGEAAINISQFDVAKIARFIPEAYQFKGDIFADVIAAWSPNGSPEIEAKLRLPPGEVYLVDYDFRQSWRRIVLDANLKRDQLDGRWLVDLADNGVLSGDLMLDGLTQQPLESQQITASLNIDAISLDMLMPLVEDYSTLAGELNSQLALTGSILQPAVEGSIAVSGLMAQGAEVPFEVETGTINLLMQGYKGKLSGNIITPDGQLDLQGMANWEDLSAWSTELNVKGDRLNVVIPALVNMEVSPDLKISAVPNRAQISGSVDIPWARINIESVPPTAVGVSEDEILLDDDLLPVESNVSSPLAIDTQVFVNLGDDVSLRAFGLNGNLKGQLNVRQNDKGQQVVGDIYVNNGVYRAFGQELLINEGKMAFSGAPDLPYLQIEAIRNPDNTEDDVIAGVRVTGTADSPELSVFSDPAMPQQNALSYLLRGRNIDAEDNGSMMTSAMIGLVLSQSGQVVGNIGQAFGVQDLTLDTSGTGDDSQVTVSGYIAPGLQVKYGVGIFNSLAEFTVRYRLMKDLYIEVVSGLDSAVDILYQFEFD